MEEVVPAIAYNLVMGILSSRMDEFIRKLFESLRKKNEVRKSLEELMKSWGLETDLDVEDTIDLCESTRDVFKYIGRKVRKIDAYKSKIRLVKIEKSRVFLADFSAAEVKEMILRDSIVFFLDVSSKSKIEKLCIENSLVIRLDSYDSSIGKIDLRNSTIFNLDISSARLEEMSSDKNTIIFFKDEYGTEIKKKISFNFNS
ncbi:MAG TPA: hypothetical protein ENG16_03060 [Archaeoglobus sp.]|nr:hypothetical protein [Archaeoglobus sp.]